MLFTTCAQLVAAMNAARATGTYERKLASLARIALLVIDDFGLKPLRPPADEDLHDLIAERYETTATIVTSNLNFTEWDQAFPANRLLASATLDRLRHNAYCLVLDGQSYRAPKLAPTTTKIKVAEYVQNHPFLTTPGCPSYPSETGSVMPIIPGSFMPIRDNSRVDCSADDP